MKRLLLMLMVAGCSQGPAGTVDASVSDLATWDLATDLGTNPDDGPIGVISLSAGLKPPSLLANTTFLPDGTAYACTTTTDGNCTYYACKPRAGNKTSPSAGAVDVTGGTQPLHFTPDNTGSYAPIHLTSAFFAGGENLTVAAAGAIVPAFSANLTAPKTATITAPALPKTDWTIDRTADIQLTWTGIVDEDLTVTLGADTTNPLEVDCTFHGSDGSGTISSASLGHLPAGQGYFELTSRASTTVSAGTYRVTFRADQSAASSDGNDYTGGAVFQ